VLSAVAQTNKETTQPVHLWVLPALDIKIMINIIVLETCTTCALQTPAKKNNRKIKKGKINAGNSYFLSGSVIRKLTR
jgi:hypothetical protein